MSGNRLHSDSLNLAGALFGPSPLESFWAQGLSDDQQASLQHQSATSLRLGQEGEIILGRAEGRRDLGQGSRQQQDAFTRALQQQAAGLRYHFVPARNQGKTAAINAFLRKVEPYVGSEFVKKHTPRPEKTPFHFNLPFPPGAWLGRLIGWVFGTLLRVVLSRCRAPW